MASHPKILVVEDLAPFRQFVVSTLCQKPEFQIIIQAADGLEAVQKAQELQPDLVLLDIGLPRLNGLEVARCIRKLCPQSKIIFLTQESSADIAAEAFASGAQGYIVKDRAGKELLTGVEAIIAGKQFISSGLKGHGLRECTSAQVPHRHEVVFYSDESGLVDSFARAIVETLKAGKAALVVVTKPHSEGLVQKFNEDCVDIATAIQRGIYISLDSSETLSTMMLDGVPDRSRLFQSVGHLMESALKAANAVEAYGEVAPLLWAEGKKNAAIQVESLWDELTKTYGVDLLCAYPLSAFRDDEDGLKNICATHTAVNFS